VRRGDNSWGQLALCQAADAQRFSLGERSTLRRFIRLLVAGQDRLRVLPTAERAEIR
jgi:hypothetical protein